VIESDNIISAEATSDTKFICSGPGSSIYSIFRVFHKITKLKGNLFHFGLCSKIDHIGKRESLPGLLDKIIDELRDSRIRISIILRISVVDPITISREILYLTRNHDPNPKNVILSDILDASSRVLPSPSSTIQLLELTGDAYLKSTNDLTLYLRAEVGCTYTVHSGSKFIMYEI